MTQTNIAEAPVRPLCDGAENALLPRKKNRIWELDFLRGVCVLLMVFDHVMVDVVDIFGKAWAATGSQFFISLLQHAEVYYSSDLRLFTQQIIVWIFALLCGISCSFSKSNLRRGILVAVFAFIITLVTGALDMRIRFGILHMFAVAILLWWLIDMICRHDKARTAVVCLVLGLAIIIMNECFMSIYARDRTYFSDNSKWYFIGEFMLGDNGFYSADYYPIFPSAGYMLLGAACAPVLYPRRRSLMPRLGKHDWYRPFNFWGKIALWVYVLHQVAVAVVLALISFLFITPGNFIII